MHALKADVKKSGAEISDALNNAIKPTQAVDGITKLHNALSTLSAIAKTPGESFAISAKAISSGLTDVTAKTGQTVDQFTKLNQQMLQTTAQKNAEKAFKDIATAAGLTEKELIALGKQYGYTADQMAKMNIKAADTNKILGDTGKEVGTQTSMLSKLTSGWVLFAAGAAAAYGAAKALKAFVDEAAEAEEVENRLRFALENVGYAWDTTKGYVDAFAKSVQESTRFSDEDARRSLTTMTLYTNDLTKAVKGSSLAMDLSVRAGIGLEEATQAVGMAMAGNYRGLTRYIPELRNLEKGMGDNMTATEKAEYALGLLEKRVGGSAAADINSYAGALKNADKAFLELKETLGRFLIPTLTESFRWLKAIVDKVNEMVDPSLQTKYDAAVASWTKIRKDIAEAEKALREGMASPDVMKVMIGDFNRQLSKQQAIIDKLGPQLKKAAKELEDFKPIADKPIFDKNAAKEQEEVLKRLKKMEMDYYENLGKSDTAIWETKAGNIKDFLENYDKALKWAADEFKKTGQAVTKDGLAEWDVATDMFPRFKEEIDRITQYGVKEWEKATKDMTAIAEWETMVDPGPAIAAIKQMTDAEKAHWVLKRSIAQDVARMEKNDYELRIKTVNEEYDAKIKAAKNDAETIASLAEWKRLKLREIYEQQAIDHGTFWDGMAVQYNRNIRDQITWGEQGAAVWNKVMGKGGILEGTLNTFFDDLFAGELKTAEEYFDSFAKSILKMFAQMIAQMVAQWAAIQLGNLLFGSGTFSGGGGGGAIIGGGGGGGGLVSNASTVASTGKAALAAYDYFAAGGTIANAPEAVLSYLSGGGAAASQAAAAGVAAYAAEGAGVYGIGGYIGVEAGTGAATSAMSGIGAGIAAAAPFMAVAAIAAGIYWAYSKGKAEQIYGLNPFSSEYGPALVASDDTLQYSAGDVNQLDWYKGKLPSVSEYRKRWFDETGGFPPMTKMLKKDAGRYLNWMDAQPEMVRARKEYVEMFNRTHYWTDPSDGTMGYWSPGTQPTRYAETTYAAEGAYINEPMVAYGRSGKRIVMGEAGPEYIVPAGAAGQMIHLSLSLDTRVIGEAIYDLSKKGRKVVHQRGIAAN